MVALALVLLTQHRQLYRHGQDAVAKLYYGLDPILLGRSEELFPAPHCCRDESCSNGCGSVGDHPQRRVAVVTYLRDDAYLPLLQQLECTLRRTNPLLELGLMHVRDELGPGTLQLARALNITLLPVAPLDFPNTYEARWGRGRCIARRRAAGCAGVLCPAHRLCHASAAVLPLHRAAHRPIPPFSAGTAATGSRCGLWA